MITTRPRVLLSAAAILTIVTMSACSPSSKSSGSAVDASSLGISDADYSLDKLIAAAKKEKGINVTDTTGKIVEITEAFSAEYGVKATGVKLTGQQQVDIAKREAQAGSVKTDVLLMTDSQAAVGDLIPKGTVTSWLPPDLSKDIAPEFQNPLMVTQEPIVFAYNTQKYGETCPVDNMWALTDKKWRAKVALPDPLSYNYYSYWWNQLATNHDDDVAQAYEDYFGKPLETDEDSATAAWVKALAANKPQMTKDDDTSAAAAGAPDQKDPFIGFMSAAKFRNNDDKDYRLGICSTMKPWAGLAYTKAGVIASGTESPNTAKLFIRYVLTQEGIGLQTEDGKKSTNTTVTAAADEPSGIADRWDNVLVFSSDSMKADLDQAPEWNDFWTAARS